jgi:hypothetical protein
MMLARIDIGKSLRAAMAGLHMSAGVDYSHAEPSAALSFDLRQFVVKRRRESVRAFRRRNIK